MTQWNGKRTQIIILILLLCLGPVNYFHLQHTEPLGMSKTLICSQRHTIYRCCNNLQFNILFHNFVKLAFCSSLLNHPAMSKTSKYSSYNGFRPWQEPGITHIL